MTLNESIVETAALAWFADLGYTIAHVPHLADAGGTLTRPLCPAISASLRFPRVEEVRPHLASPS